MRILLVSVHFAPAWIEGGVTISSWNLMRGLAAAGATVRVVTTRAYLDPASPVAGERSEAGISITTLPILGSLGKPAHLYGLAPGIARAIWRATRDADLCLLQGVWTLPVAIASLVCRLRRRPYVLLAWGTLEEVSLSEKAAKKRLYMKLLLAGVIRRAAAVWFVSESESHNSRAALGSTVAIVAPGGIDPVAPQPRDGTALKRRFGVPEGTVLLGLAGRVVPRKGFDVALGALARTRPIVHLVSFGPDPEVRLEAYREQARALGLARRFHSLGYLEGDELQSTYASIDLLVLPSYGESFGNVVIEALLQGTEVLVSDRVALAEFVRRQRLGGVVQGHDPRNWCRAIEAWIDRAEPFDRPRAREIVLREFDLVRCGERLLRTLRARTADSA